MVWCGVVVLDFLFPQAGMVSDLTDEVRRIYVGGLPASTTSEELSALISKVALVSFVYIPPVSMTGMKCYALLSTSVSSVLDFLYFKGVNRGFAIVHISGTDDTYQKCIDSH